MDSSTPAVFQDSIHRGRAQSWDSEEFEFISSIHIEREDLRVHLGPGLFGVLGQGQPPC